MSHFSVFVIGEDAEKQLAPYHEFECTGVDDEYVQDVDVTEECREHGLEYYGLDKKLVTSETDVDRAGEHMYGYALVTDPVNADATLVKAVNRTNPNKKWDWYQLGGRWSGFLLAKAGCAGVRGRPGVFGSQASSDSNRFDVLRKGEIDFDGMRDQAGREAGENWDLVRLVTGGKDWLSWEYLRDTAHKGDIEAARTAYNEQSVLQALKSDDRTRSWWSYDEYLYPRDVYVQRARDSAVSPFALVMNGQWYERGSMGWWGMVADEKDADTWNKRVSDLLDSIPDDTTISVVDCHI